jgi:hypothetical protein
MASFLRQAEAKVERKKDIDLFLSLQQADPEAALNPATAPGQMRKMCIVQVTGCPKSLKCLILIQTHTGNRWVSAIEFGQIHKVWETTHRMEDAGRSKFQLGTLLHVSSRYKLCAVWCQVFLKFSEYVTSYLWYSEVSYKSIILSLIKVGKQFPFCYQEAWAEG